MHPAGIPLLLAISVQARRSALYASPQGHLFQQLLDLLAFYCDFPMDDHTGEQLKEDDVTARHYDKVWEGKGREGSQLL
jgi:hypothetical protein